MKTAISEREFLRKAARYGELLLRRFTRGLTGAELSEYERLAREVWPEIDRRYFPRRKR